MRGLKWISCSFSPLLCVVLGCAEPSSLAGLERAAEPRMKSIRDEQVYVIDWAADDEELAFLDDKAWRKSRSIFHPDTLKYEIVKPESKTTAWLGLVSFGMTFEYTPYYKSESEAEASDDFLPPTRVNYRIEYHLVEGKWEFGRVAWYDSEGNSSPIDPRLLRHFGSAGESQ